MDELSFELPEEARLITIAGPDGAGKSTLLRLLVGLLTPDAGEVRVLGLSPDKASLSGRTGFMPQKFGLYEELTVLENLETFAALRGVPKAEAPARFSELLSLTGLAGFEERRAGALSGGMKQKLGLAASLLATPELLFLDEPTVGVDPLSRRELKNILRTRTEKTGMRALVTTSNLPEAEEADLVLLMDKGRLLDIAAPEAARRRLSRRTFLLRATNPADGKLLTRGALHLVNAVLGEKAPFLDASPKADGVAVLLERESGEEPLREAALAAGLPDLSVETRPPLMEDVYVDAAFPRKATAGFSAPDLEAGLEDAVIEAEGISRRFGNFTAVADTSFTVKKGEIFGLLGPNGAGKTTTFRMLCGLLAPSGGNIRVCGVSLEEAAGTSASAAYRSKRRSLKSVRESATSRRSFRSTTSSRYGRTSTTSGEATGFGAGVFASAWRSRSNSFASLPMPTSARTDCRSAPSANSPLRRRSCTIPTFSFWTRRLQAPTSRRGALSGGASSRSRSSASRRS